MFPIISLYLPRLVFLHMIQLKLSVEEEDREEQDEVENSEEETNGASL